MGEKGERENGLGPKKEESLKKGRIEGGDIDS